MTVLMIYFEYLLLQLIEYRRNGNCAFAAIGPLRFILSGPENVASPPLAVPHADFYTLKNRNQWIDKVVFCLDR